MVALNCLTVNGDEHVCTQYFRFGFLNNIVNHETFPDPDTSK